MIVLINNNNCNFSVVLITLGIFEASKRQSEPSTVERAREIFDTWITYYSNVPKFAEKLDAILTLDQKNLFSEVSHKVHSCLIAINENDTDECVEIVMENYKMKEIRDLVEVFEKVKGDLMIVKSAGESIENKCEEIFHIYLELVPKAQPVTKLFHGFTLEEREFVEKLVAIYNYFIFHWDDMNSLAKIASLHLGNDEMIHRVYRKFSRRGSDKRST